MKKVKIEITAEIELHYDENSQEFKDAFEGYKTIIQETDDPNDMLENIAHIIAKYGCDELIEGCGYVSINGKKQVDYFQRGVLKDWCGVDVKGSIDINDTINYDIYIQDEDEK
jgi:hypothetical protein